MDTVLGSGLIIEVPDAEPAVGEPRSRLDGNARLGIPAHITVLFPFMPPAYVDDAVLHRLAGIFAAVSAFEHRLVRTSWFDEDVLWLAPEDVAPFRSLTESVHREFPDYPPFGGRYEDVVPHLTIADRCPLEQMLSSSILSRNIYRSAAWREGVLGGPTRCLRRMDSRCLSHWAISP